MPKVVKAVTAQVIGAFCPVPSALHGPPFGSSMSLAVVGSRRPFATQIDGEFAETAA
jgi:hypothetical protein